MSSLGTYLAAGAAVAGVSEATGATAFTPVGQQARQQQGGDSGGGGGPAPSIDLDLGGQGQGASGDALGQLAEAFQQQQSGPSAVEIAQLVQSAGGDDGAASALSDALEQQRNRTEEWRRRWEAAQEGDVDGDGEKDTPDVPDVPSLPDTPDLPDAPDVPGGTDGGPSTLDKTARAGEQAEGAVRFIAEGANTLGTTIEALGGGDYSTEDTYYGRFFDDGGKTRNIDYPDVPDIDLPSKDDYEKPDQTMSEKAADNVSQKIDETTQAVRDRFSSDSSSSSRDEKKTESGGLGSGGVFGGDSSTSSSKDDEKDDEPIISLPDDVLDRNTGSSSRSVGFTQ